MRALLIIVVLCVIGWFWMKRDKTAAPPARPPASERPVSAADPKAAMERARAAGDAVKKGREEADSVAK